MTLQTLAKARGASAASQATAPYYVISRGANQGYVIVAGDDCLPEVLGYTEQGDFDETNIPEGLQDMLDAWAETVEKAQADGTNVVMAKARKAQRRAATTRTDIAPFVTSHWHQSGPYNDHCPTLTANGNRAATGCVATAASQILYYWRRDLPSTLQASTPTYGYGDAPVTRSVPKGTPLKWDLMLDSYGSESAEYKDMVAEFVFAMGAATWLTYGASTSGHIEKIPYTFSAYYGMNGGTVHYRNSYSQEQWTQLIYDELVAGRPVMYTGVHPDQGGHAVFIHGYRKANDLFYFNFGWGGSNDGYYTTTTTDGMNGFYSDQSALIGAYPKSWNMEVDIVPPDHVYANTENQFTVKVKNQSTLPLRGIYLFAATSSTKPSKLTGAKSSDTETVIATGETGEVTLTATPTSDKDWYITVTDENLNVLAKTTVTPEIVAPELELKNLSIDGSTDVETFNGEDYQVVYNTRTTAYATIANRSAVGNESNQRMYFYTYNDEAGAWEEVGYKIGKLTIGGHAEATVAFGVTNTSSCPFEVGKYYQGKLAATDASADEPIDASGVEDAVIRFILKENDMEVVSFEDGCLTLKGHFDVTAFNSSSFAAKSAYKDASVYDLTQCTAIREVFLEQNPNALIYVADDSQATGTNVVKGGSCASLSLTPGYSFTPRAELSVADATLTVGEQPAKWYLLTAPFEVAVPDGMIAREIMSHSITGISSKTTDVKTLQAGKSYLLMSSSSNNLTLVSKDVKVVAAPVPNTDVAVVGTYINTTAPANAQLLNDAESQYFVPVSEGTAVEALRGYWQADDLKTTFRAYSDITMDPAYLLLAQNIQTAYQVLNKYSEKATASANQAFLAKIHDAEKEFSNREETELTTSSKVKSYAAQLLTDADDYVRQSFIQSNMEVDFTANIVNPSFESSTGRPKGWMLGTKEGYPSVGSVVDGTKANNNRAVGLDGSNVFQSLIVAADSTSVGISQVVEGLVPGRYRLTAMVGTDETHSVTLFAGSDVTTVEGHPFGHLYLVPAVIDNIVVEASEGAETATLEIGIQEGRWYKADNFTLTLLEAADRGEADAIIDVEDGARFAPQGIYTLQGVRVAAITQPGIYIVDGKKVYYAAPQASH